MRALHRPRLPQRRGGVAFALALTAATSGCGFANALAHPAASSDGPPSSVVASATASPAGGAAALDLVGSLDGRPASLQVSAIPSPTGAQSDLLPAGCHLAAGSAAYGTIAVTFVNHARPTKQTGVSSNLRLDLAVTGADGVGILAVQNDPTGSCDNSSQLPSTTTVQSQDLDVDEHQTFTVTVVGPAGSAGPDALRGVTLQLRNPRHHPDDIDSGAWTWEVEHVSGGRPCPGDPNTVCVPLA